MKLRYLLITVVCVLFLCVISKEADANSYDSWRYDFMPGSSTEVYISGYNPSDDAVPIKLIVPESFNGYTVTGIYYYALDKEGITHLVLPSSFHTIVDYNGQTMLSKCLSLPDSLQYLDVAEGNAVFFTHDNALYRSNTLIQVAPASECETVHILDGTVAIWAGAFGDSQHLKNLDIPATVTDLELVPDSERYYFSRYFPKSLESFTVEKDNPVYQSEDGLLYRGNALDCCPSSKAEELLKIREGTEIIEHYAFYDCDLIRSIRLPSSVREIQSIAFFGCKILENISSLSNVSQIEESAICYCWKLHSLGWDSDNESYQMIDGALIDRKTQTLITMIDDAERLSVKIPDGVLRIGSDALTCLGKMERIDLPVSLTEIGDSAFCYTDLREAVLPAHVNNMGTEVFWGCSELETVILPKNLQTLPD